MSSFPLSALCVLTVRLQCGLSVHFGGAFLHELLSLICLVCAHCATAMRPQCPLWRSFSPSAPFPYLPCVCSLCDCNAASVSTLVELFSINALESVVRFAAE